MNPEGDPESTKAWDWCHARMEEFLRERRRKEQERERQYEAEEKRRLAEAQEEYHRLGPAEYWRRQRLWLAQQEREFEELLKREGFERRGDRLVRKRKPGEKAPKRAKRRTRRCSSSDDTANVIARFTYISRPGKPAETSSFIAEPPVPTPSSDAQP